MSEKPASSEPVKAAYLVFDTESIPDGRLLAKVKYPELENDPDEAVERARQEQLRRTEGVSDFLPVSFQIPVAICVARVGSDMRLQALRLLDEPHFRPRAMVESFWAGLAHYGEAFLVSFNGRRFDLPLLELAAFRYGLALPHYFGSEAKWRRRFNSSHIDLLDLLSNYGAIQVHGGLHLFSKLLGKPGKMDLTGADVYALYRQGRVREIAEYCCFDVLDTYFVFLRTQVLCGRCTLEQEQTLIDEARSWLVHQAEQKPFLKRYLERWGAWEPWP
ncbi:MAG: 3'-5' exonuclease [Gemmataceae bacterium]